MSSSEPDDAEDFRPEDWLEEGEVLMEEVPLEELVGNDAQDGAPQAAEAEVVLPFAEAIGADAYCRDAAVAAETASALVSEKRAA